MNAIRGIVRRLRTLNTRQTVARKVGDKRWAEKVVAAGVDPATLEFDEKTGSIYLRDIDLRLNRIDQAFVLRGLVFAEALCRVAGARFSVFEDIVQVSVDGLRLEVRTFEELFILHEIFVEGVYNLIPACPSVLVDIGLNVGYTSLFFARMSNIVKVYGFEPVAETHAHASRNLRLNPQFEDKIESFDFGLSDRDESVDVDFSEEVKGSIGIRGLAHRADIDRTRLKKTTLNLKNIKDTFTAIVANNPGKDIIVKMDCEGSEYKLIDSLFENQLLTNITALILEWHESDRLVGLQSELTRAGFSILSFTPHSNSTGMFYALRSRNGKN